MADDSQLLEVLQSLRERGALGESSLTGAVAHAESFVAAVPPTANELLDLGSGGGLPGLVIAVRLPHLRVTLTDRRERRMDLLVRAATRLRIDHRVTVRTGDVRRLAREPQLAASFDVVTARSFGEPAWTMECAAPFLRPGGVLIVSEPPSHVVAPGARWSPTDLDRFGFERLDPSSQVQVLRRRSSTGVIGNSEEA